MKDAERSASFLVVNLSIKNRSKKEVKTKIP
jgi:hypothetical protein